MWVSKIVLRFHSYDILKIVITGIPISIYIFFLIRKNGGGKTFLLSHEDP